jgi:glycosyltransferase involved in cell wall biosynthesis
MHILGLMFVHNGGHLLGHALQSFSCLCDEVYVVDDRSADETMDRLEASPIVTNVFTVSHRLPHGPWYHSESALLNLLYRMADLCVPDWILFLDHDQVFQCDLDLRSVLSSAPSDVIGYSAKLESVWHDLDYPRMVPLMGSASRPTVPVWRYVTGLSPGSKRLHNGAAPNKLGALGDVIPLPGATVVHYGWDTLAKRLEKVDLYLRLDPDQALNNGVPYDRGLLFGYARDEVDLLVEDYRRKVIQEHGVASNAD